MNSKQRRQQKRFKVRIVKKLIFSVEVMLSDIIRGEATAEDQLEQCQELMRELEAAP